MVRWWNHQALTQGIVRPLSGGPMTNSDELWRDA
jgi:hypothetical protein